ncbi:divalent metal cation transporter [Candidatus Parcubacteria bacterium]|nr:MAG: divalent metal cation transporter [Candidatus Parcubacteria bacterium]
MIKKLFRLPFFAIVGPGLIAAAAGNDPGGIATYSVAGAKYGFSLLWAMIPLTIGFMTVQEMAARLGAATGKGFSDLVRENFSLRATMFMMAVLFLGNCGIVVTQFVGIAASMELFGISKYITVPVAGVLIWWLIVKGTYPKIEKIFLLMSGILISYIITALYVQPDWLTIGKNIISPVIPRDTQYITFLVAIIGTTIAPFMQIFAQSSVVEKGITMSDFKFARLDTFIGTIFANTVAVFIIITTASTLFPAGVVIETAADAAQALVPFAGQFAQVLFAVGLLGASLLAAGVVPLTTSFALSNAFGWESGVNRTFEEAPIFYAIFTFLIVFAATITLSPSVSLIRLLVGFQIVNGVLLPIQLYFMLKLANDKGVMGKYRNSLSSNIFAYGTAIFVSIAAILFLGTAVLQQFGLLQ